MKKIIFIVSLLFLPLITFAWDDCPRGEINCTGECGAFVDTNNDGICDHSQPNPADLAINDSDKNEISEESQSSQTVAAYQVPKSSEKNRASDNTYHLFSISLVTVLVYLVSAILVKLKKISLAGHRKFWNIMLLISFLISAILGILLVLRINYGLSIPHASSLFWHVELGIVMAVISIFHIIWHWRYLLRIIKSTSIPKNPPL